MTFQPSAPHRSRRWLALLVVVMTLTVIGAGLAFAHGATSIPANYAGGVQVDVHGANDVPGQVDMTQMGRDTSENPDVRIFWAWDSHTAWTGNGQTGDACALFDNDSDGNINYVVCARVSNTNADPELVEILPASADHPVYLFDCTDKKNDRCTQPTPRAYAAGQVVAGPLGGPLTQSGAGNLISETDPFPAGESHPHDSTIDIRIASALVPTGARLANVCSYPSAGNGGNNNPFDCIVTPGVQFGTLRVVKNLVNDNGGSADNEDFSFKVNGGSSVSFETDGTNDLTVAVGTYSVVENAASGYTTTYTNSLNGNSNCTNLTVTAGGTTTCTIKNDDQAATLIVKKLVINDSGGTGVATDFTFSVNGGAAVTFLQDPNDADTKKGQNTLTVDAGTYTITEPAVSGYATTYTNCTNVVIANGGTATCTITNNDIASTPGISTVMKWTLNDAANLSGFVSGGGVSTMTFNLYKDSPTCTGTPVFTQTVNVNDANGTAETTTGYTTTVAAEYRWVASFSGNSFNGPITADCDDEVTTLP